MNLNVKTQTPEKTSGSAQQKRKDWSCHRCRWCWASEELGVLLERDGASPIDEMNHVWSINYIKHNVAGHVTRCARSVRTAAEEHAGVLWPDDGLFNLSQLKTMTLNSCSHFRWLIFKTPRDWALMSWLGIKAHTYHHLFQNHRRFTSNDTYNKSNLLTLLLLQAELHFLGLFNSSYLLKNLLFILYFCKIYNLI